MRRRILHRVTDPSLEEWTIVEPYVLNHALSPAVDRALRGHEGWFNLLDELGLWRNWLASKDSLLINAAIWFLEDNELHKTRSEEIARLFQPYLNAGEEWNQQLKRVFSWGVAHHSEAMTQIYFGLIRRGLYDDEKKPSSGGDFWGNHYTAENDNPRFIIDLVRCWLDHTIAKYDDGESWNFLDQAPLNQSGTGSELLGKAANTEPLYYIEQLLPIFVETVLKTAVANRDILLNRAWPYLNNSSDPHDINDSIFHQIRQVLGSFAKSEVGTFRRFAEPLKQYHHETFAYLLLMSYAANPIELADECVQYMCDHQTRLNIGYGAWSGGGHGESAVSREAIIAVSSHCSEEMIRRLEDAVIGYCDAYERENPGRRGFGELLVLRSIAADRRSNRANVRISELECGFPNIPDDLPPRDDLSMATFVGSPIPDNKAELMTDDQWLSAMKTYDGTTDRFLGGPVELSRVLAKNTRRNRVRFANLAMLMPLDIEPMYFSAILDGLCGYASNLSGEEKEVDEKDIANTPTELFARVIRRLHSIESRPCGSSVAHCIEQLADREFSADIIEILSFYATKDPDPDCDIWLDKTRNYYGGDPYAHGINTVRGRAAMAIGVLFYADQKRFPILRSAIEALVVDPVISVRTCAIAAITPILNFDRDEAVRLFVSCCEITEAIWSTSPFVRFVHFAIHTHYPAIRDLLQSALHSKEKKAVKSAASQIILADLGKIDIGQDARHVRTGSEWLREAACHAYAHNIDHPEVGDKCSELLTMYFDDDSEEVRKQIGHAFWRMDGIRLLSLESMILKYIESRSFETDAKDLFRVLSQSTVELPKVACRAAERIIAIMGEKGGDIRLREASIAHSISALIVRQYAQSNDPELKCHCLDQIDQMERLGYMGITDELNKLDR